ncbi:MAG: zinc ribbon domain-containing protein [Planctomycetota bacterium]|nr:zinc ribbon domain-containing protein [Planctomycetota bacterium]
MGEAETKTCHACGEAVQATDAFCHACGAKLEPAKAEAGAPTTKSFVLDDDAETPAKTPRPPPADPKPAPEPEPEPAPAPDPADDDIPVIELDDEPEMTTREIEKVGAAEAEPGSDTVRMPLSEVVKAWEEDAPHDEVEATDDDDADASSGPGLPVVPILILVGIVLLIVLLNYVF